MYIRDFSAVGWWRTHGFLSEEEAGAVWQEYAERQAW